MPVQIVDDDGESAFVDDDGENLFVDDLGNFTIAGTLTTSTLPPDLMLRLRLHG
jgi:hypothetical protein